MTLTDRLNFLLKGQSRTGPSVADLSDDIRERLMHCLPRLARQSLSRRYRRLIIEPDGMSARLFLASGQEREDIGEIDINGQLLLPERFTQGTKNHEHTTELLMPSDAVLTRTVSFPAQVRGNLPQVIGYELDRLSPFQANEVAFDYSLHAGSKGADRLTLDLALCRRDRLDDWIKRFTEAGSPIDRITWRGAWPRANLLSPTQRPRRRRIRFTFNKLFMILILLLVGAALLTPLWQKSHIAQALDAEVQNARAQAVKVDDLRQELERARQGSMAVLQQKWDQPPILEILLGLTDRLPDDTWIQNLEFNQDQVDLRGESEQATALIALLEQAPGIDDVSFKSPVTQIARTGKERFNISFRFVRSREE